MSESDDRDPVTAAQAPEPAARRVFRLSSAAVVVTALVAGVAGGATSAALVLAFSDHGSRTATSANAVAKAPSGAPGPTASGRETAPGDAQGDAGGGRPGQAATSAAAWLGVRLSPVDATLARAVRVPATAGVMVASVEPSSPAAKAGLEGTADSITIGKTTYAVGGDVITAIDGTPVATADALSSAIRAHRPGDVVRLAVVSDGGDRRTVAVTLGTRPAKVAAQGQQGLGQQGGSTPQIPQIPGLQIPGLTPAQP